MRKIAVVGMGYVGLITAVGLADFGNHVVGLDKNSDKIRRIRSGDPVIFEPSLSDYLSKNVSSGRLSFDDNVEKGLRGADVVLIAVGTPTDQNGDCDLGAVWDVVDVFDRCLVDRKLLVVKSTVPVGTNHQISEKLLEHHGRDLFEVISNPEFLREGRAIQDFYHPDRVVLGGRDSGAIQEMKELYRPLYLNRTPFVVCTPETAELIKYASNSFLALKVAYINQVANLCDKVGSNVIDVATAMGMDGRIGSKFLHPGPGFGGSCFPKDAKAFASIARREGAPMTLVEECLRANDFQKHSVVSRLVSLIGDIGDRRIAILGLAFKNQTDDIRDSPSIEIINDLLSHGARVSAHDPRAIHNMQSVFPGLEYDEDEYEAAKGADAVLIATEWNEYRNLDLERLRGMMKSPVILDTRNVLDPETARATGFRYAGIGKQ